MKKLISVVLCLFVVVAGIFFVRLQQQPQSITTTNGSPEPVNESPQVKPTPAPLTQPSILPPIKPFKQSESYLANDPTDPKQVPPEAIQFSSPDIQEKEAVFLAQELLHLCAYNANQGYLVTGFTNREVTESLLGKNYRGIAYLPENHSRINKASELIDQWETPYEFHFLSSKKVEVRSAGPDREFYTEDDLVADYGTPSAPEN